MLTEATALSVRTTRAARLAWPWGIGAELRKLREAAGRSSREAAALLGVDQSKMSHLEAGRVGVSEARVRRLAHHYACDDGPLVDALVAMATERARGWWEEYRGVLPPGFMDLAELEHHARFLHSIEITQIPGLFQTEDHARAVFAYVVPQLPLSELEVRVEYRMRRQAALADRAPAVEREVVIHEAALRLRVGDRKVARAQLKALVEATEGDGVTVRVIPFDADGFAGAGYSMLYVGGAVERLDTVQLDAAHSGVFLDREPQLRKHRSLYDKVRSHSVGPAESRDFMHKVAREI